MVLSGCATQTKKQDINGQFYSGKAEIFDKKKQKNETVRFYVAVDSASPAPHFRMDVTAGMLNIPMGTLILNGPEAQFVNLIERKNYRSKDGGRALEKILKAPLKPEHVVALFSEQFPLAAPWQCQKALASSAKCETVDLFLEWQKDNDGKRQLTVDSEKSRIHLDYKANDPRRVSYDWLQPSGFEEIWMSME